MFISQPPGQFVAIQRSGKGTNPFLGTTLKLTTLAELRDAVIKRFGTMRGVKIFVNGFFEEGCERARKARAARAEGRAVGD